ncbi:MAG: tubulin-like doman-containing protein [Anaerolineae bacterium]
MVARQSWPACGALDSARAAAGQGQHIQVVLVSSLAGGTGAGMATDLAILLRTFNTPLRMSAILVLPDAFGDGAGVAGQDREARSYAAWREFGRMRLTGQAVFPYEFQHPRLDRYRLSQPIVDALYLVGGKRWNGAPLFPPGRPASHAFPATAQFICTLIDGQTQTQDANPVSIELVAVNDRALQVNHDEPLYAAFGAWVERTIVLRAMRGYAKEVNRGWLSVIGAARTVPKSLPDGSTRDFFEWAPDENAEAPGGGRGVRGATEASLFLRSPSQTYADQSAVVTAFVHDIGAVCYPTSEADQLLMRQAFLGRVGFAELEARFVQRGGTLDLDSFRQASGETDPDLAMPSSRDAGVLQPPDWFDQVVAPLEAKLEQVYGGSRTLRGEETLGSYGSALSRVRDDQVQLFKNALRLKLQSLLMGFDTADFVKARRGKPGFSLDFLRQLRSDLQTYRNFLADIALKRNRLGAGSLPLLDAARKERDEARAWYHEVKHTKLIFGYEIGSFRARSLAAQDRYREAVANWIQVRKEDLVLQAMTQAADTMQQSVDATVKGLEAWQTTLTGDPTTLQDGLYEAVARQYDASGIAQIRAEMGEVQNVRVPTAQAVDNELLGRVLERVRWETSAAGVLGDGLRIDLRLLALDDGIPLSLLPAGNDAATNANLAALEAFAQGTMGDLPELSRIVPWLMTEYADRQPADLADALQQKGVPMLQVTGGAPVVQQWLSVATCTPTEQQFIEGVRQRLLAQAQFALNTYLVGSDDPYTLTYLQVFRGFTAAQVACRDQLRQRYWEVAKARARATDRSFASQLMHVLPAEQHALELELYLREVLGGNNAEELHPQVVACLEDNARATLFLWACLFELARAEPGTQGKELRVRVPVPSGANGEPHPTLLVGGHPITIAALGPQALSDTRLWVQGMTNFVNQGVRVSVDGGGQVQLDTSARVPYPELQAVVAYYQRQLPKGQPARKVLDAIVKEDGFVGRWRAGATNLRLQGQAGADAAVLQDLARVSTVLLARDCGRLGIDIGLGDEGQNVALYRAKLAMLLQGQDPTTV